MRAFCVDLENTLVKDWFEPDWLDKKANFIRSKLTESDLIFIYSFAIYGIEDLQTFNLRLRKPIEIFFGRPVVVITKDRVVATVCKYLGIIRLPERDFTSIFGKDRSFIEFVRANPEEFSGINDFILFDDMAEKIKVEVANKKIEIVRM